MLYHVLTTVSICIKYYLENATVDGEHAQSERPARIGYQVHLILYPTDYSDTAPTSM